MNDDAAPQDQPDRPSDGPRRHDPSAGRPHASPGGARRGPGGQRDDLESEREHDDIGPSWGQVPVDEPAHDDEPRFGSVDSAAFAPAGRRPPTTTIAASGLTVLHSIFLLAGGLTTSQNSVDRLTALIFGGILLAAGTQLLRGRRWARVAIYLLEVLTIFGIFEAGAPNASDVLFVLLSGVILVLISLPESSAFFRARARR